jgi:hypothetical protein
MTALRFPVAVILRRTALVNRWISERWEPFAVEPVPEGAPTPPQRIAESVGETRWRFGGHAIELHRVEAEGYHLNLTSPDPKVFVMWRKAENPADEPAAFPVIVTVSYNEAARMLDGGESVDAVPMPDVIRQWMEPFAAEHYKPEPRRKVRRNDPFRDEREKHGPGSRR